MVKAGYYFILLLFLASLIYAYVAGNILGVLFMAIATTSWVFIAILDRAITRAKNGEDV